MDQHGELPCHNYPDAFFHDENNDSAGLRWNYKIAKSLCADCPIRLECLEYAVAVDEQYGVWGGLSPSERRQLKRNKRKGG
jgi:WhiB family redox-sensing transcriptional regulator